MSAFGGKADIPDRRPWCPLHRCTRAAAFAAQTASAWALAFTVLQSPRRPLAIAAPLGLQPFLHGAVLQRAAKRLNADQTVADREHNSLHPILRTELSHRLMHVPLDCARRQIDLLGDLLS